MNTFSKITIFCGSNLGNQQIYKQQAIELGETLADKGITLIFGGGKVGLMGVVSQACLAAGGNLLGVIPTMLKNQEMAYENEIEMLVVEDMAARKAQLIALADGFIVLPGGIGTFEEVFEVLSQLQLRCHQKPIGFLNVNHFFEPFVALMQTMVDNGFVPKENMQLFCIDDNLDALLIKMQQFKVPYFNKRI